METKIREAINKLIKDGVVTNPSFCHLSDREFKDRLFSIAAHPDKFRDSALKRKILEATNI